MLRSKKFVPQGMCEPIILKRRDNEDSLPSQDTWRNSPDKR